MKTSCFVRMGATFLSLGMLMGCTRQTTLSVPETSMPESTFAQQSGNLATESNPSDIALSEDVSEPVTDEAYVNNAIFDVDVLNSTMTVEASYAKDERMGTAFLLNKGFTVTRLVCDGEELDPAAAVKPMLYEGRYAVNPYNLPGFAESLEIHYTGTISNNPRLTTYAKETISPDFTMLRSETFCYPLFGSDDASVMNNLTPDSSLRAEITIRVPDGYFAATPYALLGEETQDGTITYRFDGDLFQLSCAIAKYEAEQLPSGAYYFLPGTDIDEAEALINPVMEQADQYLQEHFGAVEIPPTLRYIVIPDGYGAYAPPGPAVSTKPGAFASEYDMHYLIHEYIHTGWNAKTEERAVWRSRFFDEGFTCYFEWRVMGHLLGEEVYTEYIDNCKQRLRARNVQIPIAEYGEHELGDMSYLIGPVLFDEMAKLAGTESLDEATSVFLNKYRDTPVNFEIFSKEYTELCDNPELEHFFADWVYSTEGLARVLADI